MLKSIFGIVSAAAVIGVVLIPAAASAAVTSPTAPGPPVDTTVTFTVNVGELTLTAPASASLGSGVPGETIRNGLGTVNVTDNRALLTAAWTVTASSTDFTVGGATTPEIIPATDATYDPGNITKTGTITTAPFNITLSATPQTVVTGTAGIGNNTATWDPAIAVAIPDAAVGGGYSATLTQSVS